MRIVFVRHGHPDYVHDCLTELGHQHARAAAERLKEEGIEQIFSSTCGRALETAQHTADILGLAVEKCDFMREISWGPLDDQPLPFDGHPWDTADAMAARGESLLQPDWAEREPFLRNKAVGYTQRIAAMTDAWLRPLGYEREGLYYRPVGNTQKTIAAFGHGGASAAIFSRLLNLPFPFVITAMRQNYTGITIITLPDDPAVLASPQLELLNDARHIRDIAVENVYNR